MKKTEEYSSNSWKEIGEELGIYDLYMSSIIIGRVLHTIRDTLSFRESADVIQFLPDYVKVVYVSNWKIKEPEPKFTHLDELVKAVMQEDELHDLQVFSSEVGALSAVLTTMRFLNQFTDIFNAPFLSYSFRNEMRLAVQEFAA